MVQGNAHSLSNYFTRVVLCALDNKPRQPCTRTFLGLKLVLWYRCACSRAAEFDAACYSGTFDRKPPRSSPMSALQESVYALFSGLQRQSLYSLHICSTAAAALSSAGPPAAHRRSSSHHPDTMGDPTSLPLKKEGLPLASLVRGIDSCALRQRGMKRRPDQQLCASVVR